ncbi:DUF1707 domain-containing protein [Amycolatopsis rubida]|uniref:DUF1707 domain-containing protein n=1 Tax=Amycolatopsis rubida TaxID=112413 RepID=A0ABX0BUD8_9PSEU|nr:MULTISPECIES: DUF1707 domain-containing protein [Amycolatopsis]MYW93627.1 DUF1707 domain-containing protein [Amycolatopsis rubida]NEC58614.1 DUF1707 domain-containing protein [Amycolatopsis rubida]OAP23109.1 hypothetical protein A4R44_06191 [Amycolatopsis sp. M39]
MDDKIPARLRASDGDRERVAETIQAAGSEGRLTLEEVEERLRAVYAVRYTDELGELTSDLPRPEPVRPRGGGWPLTRAALREHPALRIHLGIVAVLATFLIVRWAIGGALFFWPAMPLFWLFISLVLHARVRAFRRRPGAPVPY